MKEDSDCQDVMDLMDSHGLSLMEAVRAFSRITGMNRRESRDLYRACMEYRDSGVHESANLAERMGEGRQCDKMYCENEAADYLGPGNWCSEECRESQRAYDGE